MIGWAATIASALLVEAMLFRDGALHPTALGLVCVAAGIAAGGAWVEWPRAIEAQARRALPWLLAAVLALNLARLATRWPTLAVDWELPVLGFRAGLAIVAYAALATFFPRLLHARLRLPVVVASYAVLALVAIRHSPWPDIDVWHYEQRAASLLLSAHNPYAANYPNIYQHERFFGPGLVEHGHVRSHTYPPLSVLATAAGFALGDVRLACIAAVVAAALLTSAAARRLGAVPGGAHELAIAAFLFHPRTFFMIEEAWSEPLLAAAAAGCLYAIARGGGLGVAAGALVSAKQYGVLWLPALWGARKVSRRDVAVAGALSAAIVLPFVLWNARAFWEGVFAYQFRLSFRPDSLSLAALWFHASGHPPPAWLGVAVGLGASAAVGWRLRGATAQPSLSRIALAGAATFLVVFLFHKQAFFNYYWFANFLLLGAAALTPMVTPVFAGARMDDDSQRHRQSSSRREQLGIAATALAATLLAHGLALGAGFAWDDRRTVLGNPGLRSAAALLRALAMDDWEGYGLRARGLYRPLATLSLYLDRNLLGGSAVAFHATSLLLHACTAVAIGLLVRAWGGRLVVALAAAIGVAAHPVTTEAVQWISARPDALCGALVAGALLAASYQRAILAGVAAGLACFAKEPGILAVPAIVVLLAPGSRRRALQGGAIAGGLAAAYLAARALSGVPSGAMAAASDPAFWPGWFRRFGEVSAGFARAAVWPLPLDACRRIPRLGASAWTASAIVTGLCAIAFAARGRTAPLLRAAVLLVAGPLALAALFDAGLAERYLYLPTVVVIALAAIGVEQLMQAFPPTPLVGRALLAACALLSVSMAAASARRAVQWGDPVALFGSAVEADPTNPVAHQLLGAELYHRGERQRALSEFEASVDTGGGAPAHSNLCAVRRELGDLPGALVACDKAVALDPGDPRAWFHLSLVHRAVGRTDDAVRDLRAALRATPDYRPAREALDALTRSSGERSPAASPP